MLYVLDQSVADHFRGGNATGADITGIDYLTMGVAEGSHRIGGYRTVLQTLAAHPRIPERAKLVLERAIGRVAEDGGLQQSLNVHGLVVADGTVGAGPTSTSGVSPRVLRFPLRWFDTSLKVQPTIILGENLFDVGVLERIAKTALAARRLLRLPIAYDRRGGGGSSISQSLELIVADNRHGICVVDSDKACPAGALGQTAAGVQGYKTAARFPILEVMETSGRDLENCLPDRFYQAVYGPYSQHPAMTDALIRLTTAGDLEGRAHIDIEKGLVLRQVFSYPPAGPDRPFWDTRVAIVCAALGLPPGHFPCMVTGTCATPRACTCIVVQGNPQNILQQFVQVHGNDSGHQLVNLLSQQERAEWLRLGMAIASWCCADTRLRA